MSFLRFGTHALLPTDVELVRMLLRVYGIQGQCRWSYAEAPPYDAILVEGPIPEDSPPHVLRLTRTDAADAPNTLPRPLSAHQFRAWLDSVENALCASPAPASPSPPEAAVAALEPPHLRSPEAKTETVPDHDAPASLPEVAPAFLPEDAPRFSLRRWPRAGILRGDPTRIRMASLLSRRALNARDLVSLSGCEPHQCRVFMQILHASELLIPDPPPTTETTQAAKSPVTAPPTTRPNKPPLTQSLIAGLRKRLGLQPTSAA